MEPRNLLQTFKDSLLSNATVKSVYGDPVTFGDRTIVPVARVAYGFGGGFGSRLKAGQVPPVLNGDLAPRVPGDEAGGGGGGVAAMPLGVVEITPTRTRFIRFGEGRRLAAAAAIGLAAGIWFGRRRNGS
ncbi:MAG: GerW family sporulation protein [Terriglobales bacterium]